MRKRHFKLRITKNPSPRLYRPTDKIYKMIWDFHKADADPFPSVPHGHSTNGKYKLKLWSGEVFDIQTNKLVGKSSKKEMLKLYGSHKFQCFVNDAREWFKENNPYIPDLVIPEGRITSGRIGRRHITGRNKELASFRAILSVEFPHSEVDS